MSLDFVDKEKSLASFNYLAFNSMKPSFTRLLLTEADNTINDDQDQDRVSRKSCGAAVL